MNKNEIEEGTLRVPARKPERECSEAGLRGVFVWMAESHRLDCMADSSQNVHNKTKVIFTFPAFSVYNVDSYPQFVDKIWKTMDNFMNKFENWELSTDFAVRCLLWQLVYPPQRLTIVLRKLKQIASTSFSISVIMEIVYDYL